MPLFALRCSVIHIDTTILCQHWGFNLDASIQDGTPPSIKDHKLSIAAQNIVELDPTTALSTGNLLPVKGTPYAHGEKETGKIGELFPQGGYGTSSHSNHLTSLTHETLH